MAAKVRPLIAPAKRPRRDSFDGGDGATEPFIASGKIAILMLIASELMLFSGLIGPFLVYRGEAPFWPPPGLPRLPIFVTWINTFVLLTSGVTMYLGVRAVHHNRQRMLRRWLALLWCSAPPSSPSGQRVGTAGSARIEAFERHLRRHLLYSHRLARRACDGGRDLARLHRDVCDGRAL